ncbi:MAG TPA: MBG domain-containing protein, partial [Gemmatimonadaceae bacterium]|nr:MBG domain-containing protein [Gemmatimonadaceae bacterium]
YNSVPTTTVQLTVLKADQTIAFSPLVKKTYGDAPFTLGATATSNLAVTYATAAPCAVYGVTLTIKGAGTCTITASQAGNDDYNKAPDASQQQLIDKAPLTITAKDAAKVYGAALPTFTADYATFVNGDTYASLTTPVSLTSTGTVASPVRAGGYPIIASGATSDNYEITFVNGTLTITPAPLTITADDKSKVYGAALPPLTSTPVGLVNGDTYASLTTPAVVTTTALMSSPVVASGYPITVSGATSANYNITFASGKLTVTPAPLTITADDKSKVYGADLPANSVHYATFVNNDDPSKLGGTLAYTNSASAASPVIGSPYSISPSGLTSTNYSITFVNGKLTVTPAPLTVTALNKQKVFDGLPYPFTSSDVTYSAFVLGENPSVLGGTLSFSQGATIQVGSYSNAPQGLLSTNYAITFVPGQLTIQAWTLAGFYQPVDMSTGGMVYNTVKGGSTVPLKFNIYQATQANTNERTDVAAVKAFSATPYVCTASATDEIEIVTTGGTTLRYDVTGQQFIQNWLTPKSPGTCYQVTMTTLDGSKLTAFFKLK